MDKLKHFIKKPAGLLVTLFVALLIFFVLVIKVMGTQSSTRSAKEMQGQKEAQIDGNVRYTTQETLNTVTGEVDNLTRNLAQIKKRFRQVKADDLKAQRENKKRFDAEILALKKQNVDLKNSISLAISKMHLREKYQNRGNSTNDSYQIGDGRVSKTQETQDKQEKSDFVWVNDSSLTPEIKTGLSSDRFRIKTQSAHNSASSDDLLHPNTATSQDQFGKTANTRNASKRTIVPMYTIPQNTWLTGVIAEQPLIGIVPVNGEVINPRTLSFVVQAKNLAANNWHLPAVLKGIQGDAVCQGFFAIKRPAVTCNVTSLTFIFQDGRINTINAQKDKKLGVITDLYGNPQVSGNLHSNLGYFLAGTTLFSGVQGYGNALSAAQVQTHSGSDLVPNISTIIHNANTYAAGQGLSAAAQSAQQWWVDRMKSTFDYVEVPNWNPRTHQLLQLNVKITRSIAIDYNQKGRRVIYAHNNHQSNNNSLD